MDAQEAIRTDSTALFDACTRYRDARAAERAAEAEWIAFAADVLTATTVAPLDPAGLRGLGDRRADLLTRLAEAAAHVDGTRATALTAVETLLRTAQATAEQYPGATYPGLHRLETGCGAR